LQISGTPHVDDTETFFEFFRNFIPPFPDIRDEMDQLNKYKQNNHSGRGANRRTVTALRRRPAVQILTISNVPSDILEAIDELAARQDRSRSSFVRRELQRTVAEYRAKEGAW
jgi:hypothetical protein